MNVLFDADVIKKPLTGIGYYSANLLQALLALHDITEVTCYTNFDYKSVENILLAVDSCSDRQDKNDFKSFSGKLANNLRVR